MKRFSVFLTPVLVFLFSLATVAQEHMRGHILLTAKMEGAQEVPPVGTQGVGVATLKLYPTQDSICLAISMAGLTGPITGIHIHDGLPGVAGPVVLDLMPYLVGNQVAGTLSGLPDSFYVNLLKGRYYVNAHTDSFPSGEIRGQIHREENRAFIGELNGAQETPPVASDAVGLGIFNLSGDENRLMIRVVMRDLSSTITAAHLHIAPPGSSGPPVISLDSIIADQTRIQGTVDVTPILNDLMMGNVYINVHTDSFPNGEIRAQLVYDSTLVFDTYANGFQVNPPLATTATAAMIAELSLEFDSLHYQVLLRGFNSTITAVELNLGDPAINGPVMADLTDTTQGAYFTGSIGGVALTDTLIMELLRGRIYLNVRSDNNPTGEIRGQILRQLREGYTFRMSGNQEVPPVSTQAYGSGFVSIDRDSTDVRFLTVFNNLSSDVTAAHFHQAPFGVSGPPVFDLFPYLVGDHKIEGYWSNEDTAVAFTPAIARKFMQDSIYVNVHTVNHPPGEIRGQVMRLNVCEQLEVGIEEAVLDAPVGLDVYPNPTTTDAATVRFVSPTFGKANIVVTDMLGREIINEAINVDAGFNEFNLQMNNAPKGIYMVQLHMNDRVVSKRLAKN